MLSRTGLTRGRTIDWGAAAWAGLAAYVMAYDVLAIKKHKTTLSIAFYSYSTTKSGRPLLILFWFYLTAHLFRWIPRKYDMFRRGFDVFR